MKYILHTLIYIIKDWDLSLYEFKKIGKILWWVPNLLHNIIIVLFRFLMFPIILLSLYVLDKKKRLILRFFVYCKESVSSIMTYQ